MDESDFRKRELEHIRQQLAGRDVPCPKCGYNLRDLERAECPECGWDLRLAGPLKIAPRSGRLRFRSVLEGGWLGVIVIVLVAAGLALLHFAPWLSLVTSVLVSAWALVNSLRSRRRM